MKWVGRLCLFGLLAFALVGVWIWVFVLPELPSVEQLRDVQYQVPLKVYAQDGSPIAEYGEKRRAPIASSDIPELVKLAFIGAEDDRFYEHPGVDYQGILRAMYVLIKTGQKKQGGSTITMQVARGFFLTAERRYMRKLKEILLALQIEQELDKDQIIGLYLNKIFLGNRAYGIAAAAQVYYGKRVDELQLEEIAMLAGLPKAPSTYNPLSNPERALARRNNYVLKRMLELEYISEAEHAIAIEKPIIVRRYSDPNAVDASYIGEMARAKVVELVGEELGYTGGYKVYTTLDTQKQAAANKAVRTGLLAYEERGGFRGPVGRIEKTEIETEAVTEPEVVANDMVLFGPFLGPKADDLGDEVETIALSPIDILRQQLNKFPSYFDLSPALVRSVEDERALVFTVNGVESEIRFENMAWARKRLGEEGYLGRVPEKPADILKSGDVVYVQPMPDGTLKLVQLPEVEGSLVAMDPQNGSIRALVGGFDFQRSKFNRALQAFRQPGSNFKPFIYSAALEKGFTPATLINDAPVVFDDPALEGVWRPENYSGKFYGPTRLREALIKSRNLVSVRILIALGIGYSTRYAQRFGFPREQLPRDLSLVLGSGTVTPLQMATGYSVFANGGYRVEPYFVERIENGLGEVIYQAQPTVVCEHCLNPTVLAETPVLTEVDSEGVLVDTGPRYAERVIEEGNAYIMRTIMQDVIKYGTGRRALTLGRTDLAGKTGTTNDQYDAWFSGFNSKLVASAWLGYDEQKTLGASETGSGAALPIWIDFMGEALAGVPDDRVRQPDGLVTVLIDKETGELTTADNPNRMFELFMADNLPDPENTNPILTEDPTQTLDTSSDQLF